MYTTWLTTPALSGVTDGNPLGLKLRELDGCKDWPGYGAEVG